MADHHLWAVPILNGPRRPNGGGWLGYSQVAVTCGCGWRSITIVELAQVYADRHRRAAGLGPQQIVIGLNTGD